MPATSAMAPLMRTERNRVMAGLALSAAVGVVAAFFVQWQLAVPLAWIVGAGVVLTTTWVCIWPLDDAGTQLLSTRQDDSRTAARGLLISSATASLVAVVTALFAASRTDNQWLKVVLTTVGVATVVVSWLTIQTVFTLRYAHRYYSDRPGGITFPGGSRPDYHDFAYLSFTVGMTFQVSDTEIEAREIRRVVLQQALLAYVFGTVIIAVAINLVAGIVS